jgi:hypothetical protein
VDQESERAAVEVARLAWGFPRSPEGRDDLLRQVREITAGLDQAAVMIALGALLRRGIDRALDEGREDETDFDESERFFERWLSSEERRADQSADQSLACPRGGSALCFLQRVGAWSGTPSGS